MVMAFEIRRPWPRRYRSYDAKPGQPRWKIRYHHDCSKYGCEEKHAGQKFFPWWRLSSYSKFWVLAGRGWYWTDLITVWHVEPGGCDSGEICRHYTKTEQPDGTYKAKLTNGWRWHIHHWRIRVGPLQSARRWLLTKCEWCGGPSRKHDPVNISHQWDSHRGPWWRGDRGLYHRDCSGCESSRRLCICDDPMVVPTVAFNKCQLCGLTAASSTKPQYLAIRRLLASVPEGQRSPDVQSRIRQIEDELATSN